MKFNLGELESLFEKIKDIIDYVESAKLKDRRMNLFLGNGDKILFSIPNNTVAHLLGIDTNYLISTGLYNNQNSFELLKEMCENPYKIHKANVDGIINYDHLFKEQILDKIRVFKENLKINIFQTEFVCEYKKEKSYFTTKISEDCNYIVVKKYDDESIGVLYLVKKDNYFVPMSNRIYPNQESAITSLKDILIGQEITLLTGINTYNVENDYKQSYTLSINSKTDKINNIYNYKNKLDCFIDITNDYQYTLDKLSNNRQERYVNNNIINSIVESIANNKIIDRNIYEDSVLLTVIDAWNDHICQNPNINNDNNERTYTDILKDLIAFKALAETLTEEKNELQDKITTLSDENESLKNDIAEKNETIQKVFELTKPRN